MVLGLISALGSVTLDVAVICQVWPKTTLLSAASFVGAGLRLPSSAVVRYSLLNKLGSTRTPWSAPSETMV